ncbi:MULTISPECIES: cell division protein SepF [unclassified Fusobacterium]|uniref:cell division protein SepF n=1 Tax=unclassified Fusobacterium TaxID=2648384 RepID=UPI0025C31E5D|nr:cell division protein SepF [Fusobacterium sp.]
MEKDFDIVFVKPKKYEECMRCVDYIKEDKIVHINLMDLDSKESQRILDYISGAVYIKEGDIVNPGESIFCTIPKNKKHLFDYKPLNGRFNEDEIEEIVPSYKNK